MPLLVEWPDGRREALLFVLEEESDPRRFSIHRLAHYCLDLAELFGTERVAPVVIFLRPNHCKRELALGGERHTYLHFHYLACNLAEMPYERYRDSDNIVARLNLPNMRYAPEQKVEAYACAIRGLTILEQDPEKQPKHTDFVDIYAALDNPRFRSWTRPSVRFSSCPARRDNAAWPFHARRSNDAGRLEKRAIGCVACSPFR